ncbi:ACP S-malonyltransferase [Blattabacterium cuenoti]|uniref:ACP S-malonyltransferase n=1 Tax=Blattabacterium cuenoti TaxID=1653831 RepID=UPI00163C4F06|nr:ACP S-malonyltransferase [Blattabacterium cuenoti]
MNAYIFTGQGSQFVGMGKKLYQNSDFAKKLFLLSNDILGFKITDIMFNSPIEILKKTKYTQLAIYIYSFIQAKLLDNFNPDMVAGHSLGEFSALASIDVFSFEEGLILVEKRGSLMQKICEQIPGGMAVVFGLDDHFIESFCKKDKGIVVPSNYNSPGQLVISGEEKALKRVCFSLEKKGAKRILRLPVHGAFHSPIMFSMKKKLEIFIENIHFKDSKYPIYQNVTAKPENKCSRIKKNIIEQLTSPVKWKQSVINMIHHGARSFIEIGPKNILQGMIKKIFNEIRKKNEM